MALVPGFGPLAAFIDAPEGVALTHNNGKYWSTIERNGIYLIECIKERKDSWCKFLVEKKGDGKVLLKDRRGMYLSRVNRNWIDYIEPAKSNPDVHCEFDVFTKEGKVFFRADNNMFLSMIDRGKPNIEAAKDGVDEHCEFVPNIGDIVSPKFEIIKVDFKKSPDLTETPVVVKEDSYTNGSSVEQKHTFSLSWTKAVSETTSWSHTWGLNASLSFNCFFANVAVEITYSGSYGTSSTKERSITISEQTEVTIPPKTKIIAKLFVNKDENCSIPFSATIKKIRTDGEEIIFTENGIWKGVIYENVSLAFEEKKL